MNFAVRGLAASFLLAMAGIIPAASAQRYQPSFHPADMTDRPAGQPNEVMVLGTAHLSGLPDSFRPEMVEPLVARLVAWHPTAVATENISGLACDAMRRIASHASEVESYCPDPAAAAQATGLDVPAATVEVDRLLADWPESATPAQRRRLALLFLAAGEPASALVQWLRLPEAERRAEDGLTDELVAALERRRTRKNETYLVAAQVAARVGLERVWSVDDQSFNGAQIDGDAYGAALMAAWDNPATKARRAESETLNAALDQPDGLMQLYRSVNAPGYAPLAYRSDWGPALAEDSPQRYGRRYVAYWETRNLRMVANIREVLGRDPGTRLLAVVGASHKGYYEAYLSQMRDVDLVDVMPALQ